MIRIETDIDIDFADRAQALEPLHHVDASMRSSRGPLQRHAAGVYFQNVPVDPFTGLCAFPYEEAEALGYTKIDFLNNSIYESVRDEAHLQELLDREPEWDILDYPEIVGQLAHIREHFGLVRLIKPRSIEDLAIVLALMRPGKRHLTGLSRAEIEREIWKTGDDGYSFKKAHAIAYAASIVVQMNILCDAVVAEAEARSGGLDEEAHAVDDDGDAAL